MVARAATGGGWSVDSRAPDGKTDSGFGSLDLDGARVCRVLRPGVGTDCLATLSTEARVGGQRRPASGADDLEPRATGQAELRIRGVQLVAGRTLHGRS